MINNALKFSMLLAIFVVTQNSFGFGSSVCSEGLPVIMACKRGDLLTNVGCPRVDSVRCVKVFTEEERNTYVIGKFKQLLKGKEYPELLGDSSVGLIEGHGVDKSSHLVYLPFYLHSESSNYLAKHQYVSDQGVVIGIPRSILVSPTGAESAELLKIARTHLGIGRFHTPTVFKLSENP